MVNGTKVLVCASDTAIFYHESLPIALTRWRGAILSIALPFGCGRHGKKPVPKTPQFGRHLCL